MNQDLINGTRSLDKGRIRHVHAEPGRRVECLSGSLWITQDGDRRDIVLERRRGVRLRPRRRRPAQRLRRLTLPAARRLRAAASLNRALDRGGQRQGHDLDALLAQRVGVLARGPAADAALLDLAVVDAARLLGEALADVLGRARAPGGRRAATATAASSRCSASARAGSAGAACRETFRRGALGRRTACGVAAQRAGDDAAALLRRRSRPRMRTSLRSACCWPQRRFEDLHGGIIVTARSRRGDPLQGPAAGAPVGEPEQADQRLGVGDARRGRAASSSSSTLGLEDVEELAGVEAGARRRSRPRANQTSMPSSE